MGYEIKVILLVIAIIALVGNSLTVLLFVKKSKWLKKAYGCLIFALSIQDILLAICLLSHPSIILDGDIFPMPSSPMARVMFCSFVWSHYFPFALGVTSVYTCLMLTIDRWFAAVRPMHYRRHEHSAKIVSAMVLIPWIAGFGFEITSPLNAKPTKLNDTFVCRWTKFPNPQGRVCLALFSFLGMIFIPAILMTIAYVHVILHVKKSTSRVSVNLRHGRRPNWRNTGKVSVLKRVTLTAFFASLVVILCWLPDQLYYALSQIGVTELGTTGHSFVKILAFGNSCVNPIIYCFSNKEYRKGFKEIICFACAAENERDIGLSTAEHNLPHIVT